MLAIRAPVRMLELSAKYFGKAEVSQVKNSEKQKSLSAAGLAGAIGRICLRGNGNGPHYLSGVRPPCAFALRVRAAALLRNRSIWPLGRVTQISPIHSSLTPMIGLALKLVRLTDVGDFPRSIVFR